MKPSKHPLAPATLLALILFALASLGTQAWIETKMKAELGESLNAVLETTRQAVRSWRSDHMDTARVVANAPSIVRLTEELLATPGTREELIGSPAQKELRSLLRPLLTGKDYQGFFVIGPRQLNLGSSRDQNLGVGSLRMAQKGFLERVWSGETVMSLPLIADIPLPDSNGLPREGQPTMFVGAPVRNGSGAVIAVFAFRLDPSRNFTALLERGRIGATGESYAFDTQGMLISKSHFDEQLRKAGLIGPGERGMLRIAIRDPGVDLTAGERSAMPREKQPLTRMARDAVAGRSGLDLESYRDYRGVLVVGSWLWDPELGHGIATEVDVEQAFRRWESIQTAVNLISLLAAALFLGLLAMFSRMRRMALEDEERFHGLVESAPDAMVIVNNRQQILLVNEQSEKMFGYDREELVGRPVHILLPERFVENHPKHVGEYLKAPRNRTMGVGRDLWARRKDGSELPIEIRLSPVQTRQGLVVTAAVRDITERKQAEETLKAANRELDAFVRTVSHDLRNPLTIIIGFAELLLDKQRDRLDEQALSCLEGIRSSGLKMQDLMEDLLVLARVGHIERPADPIEISAVLSEVLHNLSEALARDRISIQATALASVRIPRTLLAQLLENLIGNALKYGCRKGNVIEVGTERLGPQLRLYVRDHGPGVPEEEALRIFEPFYRAASGQKHRGSGIGLSTVEKIARLYDGRAWVEETAGGGSTFWVVLMDPPTPSEMSEGD